MTITTYLATAKALRAQYNAGLLTYSEHLRLRLKLDADYLKGKGSCLLPVSFC